MTISNDLTIRCIDAYWENQLNITGIHSADRMREVFKVLAAEIRSWAPDPSQAKICNLAINKVADRLLKEASEESPLAN